MKPSVKTTIKLAPGCFSNNPAYSPAIPSHQTNKSLPKNFCQEQLKDLDDDGQEFWFSAEEAAAHETFRKSLEEGVRNDSQDEDNHGEDEDHDDGRDKYYENHNTTEDKKINRQGQGNQIVSSANIAKSRGFYRTPDDKENRSPYLGNNTNKSQPLKKTTSAGTLNAKKYSNQYVSSSTANLVVSENHSKGYSTQSQLKQPSNCISNKNIANLNQQKHQKDQLLSQSAINIGNRRFQQQERQQNQQSQSQSRSHSKSPTTAGTPAGASRALNGNIKKAAIRSLNVINQAYLDMKSSPILRENHDNFNKDSFNIHNTNAYGNSNMPLHPLETVTNQDDKFSAKIANDIIENILDKDELYERTRVENKRLKGRIHGLESQIKVLQQNQIQTKSAAALTAQNYQQEFTLLNEKLLKLKKLQSLYIEEKKLREASQHLVQVQDKRLNALANMLQICVSRCLVGGGQGNNSQSSLKLTEIEQENVRNQIYLGLLELKEQGETEDVSSANVVQEHNWLEECIFSLEQNAKKSTGGIITGNNNSKMKNCEQFGLGQNQDQLLVRSKIQSISSGSLAMKGEIQQLNMKVSVQDTLQEEDEEESQNNDLGNCSNNIVSRNKDIGDIGLSGQQASLRVDRQLVFDSDVKSETQHQQSDYQNEIISEQINLANKCCTNKERTENEGKTMIHLKGQQLPNNSNLHHSQQSAFLDCNSTNTTSTAILNNNSNISCNIHSNKPQQLQPCSSEEDCVIASFDYIAQKDKDLSMRKGDKIKVVKRTKNGWWIGMLNKNIGYFPSNYTQEINVARTTNH